MDKKTPKDFRKESKELFLSRFNDNPPLKLEYFHTFLCPVATAEATVEEYIKEDYEVVELMVLRLYELGYSNVKDMAGLLGMKEVIVKRALDNEMKVYGHIDENGSLTEMGKKTLEESKNGKPINHATYYTLRKLQIEAVTGTVIPAYLEEDPQYMKQMLLDDVDGIAPLQEVSNDEELKSEINKRLSEYKHLDILNEGDVVQGFKDLRSIHIYYRWAYLAKFEKMKYPMIVVSGYKSIDKVNANSIKNKKYGTRVAIPLSISETDSRILKENGINFDDVIVRKDSVFEYLRIKATGFNFDKDFDIVENDAVVYEDEKVEDVDDFEDDK